MPQKYSNLAIAAFVFSLLFFMPLFSIIGIIAGIAALVNISKNKKLKGKGLAIAAIIIGVVVTALHILFFISIYGFFGGLISGMTNIAQSDPVESINYCIKQKTGTTKDMCILMAVSVHINQTENINKNLCDVNVKNTEIRNLCNAYLKKDKSYCYNIKDTESRIKCLGLLEELKK